VDEAQAFLIIALVFALVIAAFGIWNLIDPRKK
jgi:hypothetical protein